MYYKQYRTISCLLWIMTFYAQVWTWYMNKNIVMAGQYIIPTFRLKIPMLHRSLMLHKTFLELQMQYQLFTCELRMKRITGMEFEIIKLYKLSPFLLWAGCNSAQWKQWVHCSIGPIQYVVYGTGPLCSMNSRGKILRLYTLFDLAYLKWFIYCHKKVNDSVRNWDLPMTFVPGPISLTFPNAILIQ